MYMNSFQGANKYCSKRELFLIFFGLFLYKVFLGLIEFLSNKRGKELKCAYLCSLKQSA